MGTDQGARDYVERRVAEGKNKPEMIRCLKRYIAREAFSRHDIRHAELPTARSGGGVWIPNNEILKRDDVTDTPRGGAAPICTASSATSSNRSASTRTSQLAPEMLSFVLKHTP